MVGRKRMEFCNQLRECWLFRAVLREITPTDVSAKCLEILAQKVLTSEDYTN